MNQQPNRNTKRRIVGKLMFISCWALIILQSLFILQTRRPELLIKLGIEPTTYAFFTKLGLLKEDTIWRLSRDDNRDRLKEALESIDKYSTVLSEDQFENFAIDSKQEYEGIGVTLRKTNEGVIVQNVNEAGPAFKAGLEPGDLIYEVNGHSIKTLKLSEIVQYIRGRSGTKVRLSALRNNEPVQIEVRRRSIDVPSIYDVHLTNDKILYLRIDHFGSKTVNEFKQTIREQRNNGVDGIVIDLRGNMGGMFKAATELLDLFYPRGELMLETRDTTNNRSLKHLSKGPNWIRNVPTILLVNENSASASEILAGSLQVTGRALIVGSKTYGKGSIQSVYPLDKGTGYKKTTGYYYLPDGSTIHEVGITPDVKVVISQDERYQYLLRIRDNIRPWETNKDLYWNTALKQFQVIW